MLEIFLVIAVGFMLIVLGGFNCAGHIKSIHWYHRKKVADADVKKYGRCVGSGTIVIGISIIITAVLQFFIKSNLIYISVISGLVVGIVFILYGQFKYNKGIF